LEGKWLKQGQSVHLVDEQEAQLRDAAEFIQKLQVEYGIKSSGTIHTHKPSDLERALHDSWLVVEVGDLSHPFLITDISSVCQKNIS
jgi:MarR-like DNA-binding transcriptional regulator SgrR of sgrS sRNA